MAALRRSKPVEALHLLSTIAAGSLSGVSRSANPAHDQAIVCRPECPTTGAQRSAYILRTRWSRSVRGMQATLHRPYSGRRPADSWQSPTAILSAAREGKTIMYRYGLGGTIVVVLLIVLLLYLLGVI
jgi:hypothetical protein